jgi:hypothetical protein
LIFSHNRFSIVYNIKDESVVVWVMLKLLIHISTCFKNIRSFLTKLDYCNRISNIKLNIKSL